MLEKGCSTRCSVNDGLELWPENVAHSQAGPVASICRDCRACLVQHRNAVPHWESTILNSTWETCTSHDLRATCSHAQFVIMQSAYKLRLALRLDVNLGMRYDRIYAVGPRLQHCISGFAAKLAAGEAGRNEMIAPHLRHLRPKMLEVAAWAQGVLGLRFMGPLGSGRRTVCQ